MTDLKNTVEAAGFKLDKNDNIIRAAGGRVKGEVAEQVKKGAILAGFDFEALKKKKARAAQTGNADLVKALHDISPAIELLEVGQVAKIAIPKVNKDGKDPVRSFVMSVVTKLNNLTAAGREWAGRSFDSLSDPEGEFLYVARKDDIANPKVRKTGGGRKKATATDKLASALKATEEKLDGEQEATKVTGEGEAPEIKGDAPVIEDAQVIKH